MIIALHGKKRSGKDTFAKFFHYYLIDKHYAFDVKKYAFADEMKILLSKVYNIPLERFYADKNFVTHIKWSDLSHFVHEDIELTGIHQYMTVRQLLQQFGNRMRINWDDRFWILLVFNKIKFDDDVINIITDIRYQNELIECRSKGAICIKIKRQNEISDKHTSEAGINDNLFDYVLNAKEGINEYRRQVYQFLKNNFEDKFSANRTN
jgi:hypothetical protein